MAIVTALQFNSTSGAMICDEEYWFLRRRRSFFLDNLRNLIPEEISNSLGIEVAYGGYGHPGFHEEVIQRSREAIESAYHHYSVDQKDFALNDLEGIAMIVRQAIQTTRRRKVDDMLQYLYGFNTDDVNQGSWDENGVRYEIKQESVLNDAKKIINYERKDGLTDAIFKNKTILIGFDPTFGFRGFHLNAENTVCSLISGGFEAIGAGLYGAGVEFSKFMNRLLLDQRRDGFDRVWGMIQLFEAAMSAYETFHEVGGGLNLIYIDGKGKSHKERYMEVHDAKTRLVFEMIRAKQFGLLSSNQLYPLVNSLIFNDIDRKTVEQNFFNSVHDKAQLHKLLRGYKISPFPPIEIVNAEPKSMESPNKKGGKKQ